MKSKLHYTLGARRDTDEIWDYIARDLQNRPAADRVIDAILSEAERLMTFPELGTPLSAVTEIRDGADYRYLTSGSYMIFYRAVGTDVYIDRVLYGGRDYLRVLGLRAEEPEEE